MSYRKVILASVTVSALFVFLSMAGCGERKSELNLPDQESKQLKAADAKQVKTAESGPQAKPEAPATGVKAASPTGEFKKFFVYADQGYFKNHYIPAGWMGDYGDIKYNDSYPDKPYSRKSSIKIVYTAQKKQGAGWAGIYWQDPANNWGNLKGGYDLTGAKKLTFWARGDKGGEVITEFKMGGINGEHSDSASSSIGPIQLTPEWKEYTIDLKDEDLSLVIGGFAFVISSMENPSGATFYMDDIAYE
jgi:predicted small lipoprotein YifL